jgi:ABC-type branched-subunit amino acid transport system substrate-binding protein
LRRVRAAAPALLLAAILLPGCGSGGSSGPKTLSIYVSVPLHGGRAADGRAIAAGARKVLARAGGRVGSVRVRAFYLDDTGGGQRWSMVATAANARRAAQDTSAVGFIGDVDSGATRMSLPITNQAEIVQISPASTATDLTLDTGGTLGPDRYQPSGELTFARIVPNDEVLNAAARGARRRAGGQVLTAPDGSLPAALSGCRPSEGPVLIITPFARPAGRYGEEAMSLLLAAIREAGSGADRGAVRDGVLATANRPSPLGRYSIDASGDTTLRRVGKVRLGNCAG